MSSLEKIALAKAEVNPIVMAEYAELSLGGIHRSLISNPNVTPQVLHVLAKKLDYWLKIEIASRADLLLETHLLLASDKNYHVRLYSTLCPHYSYS